MLLPRSGIACACVIAVLCVPCYAAGDNFTQDAQKVLDTVRGREGWKSHRCMIRANVTRDMVVAANDSALAYGDKILEVDGKEVPAAGSAPVVDLLRALPPSGFVKLRILRGGTEQVLSVQCGDAAPVEALTDDAIASAASGNFGVCSEKFAAVAKVHELNWALAAIQFACLKRASKLPTTEAKALYELDRQVIRENAFSPDTLQKLSDRILADVSALSRQGAADLAAQVKSDFESARGRATSEATHAASVQSTGGSVAKVAETQVAVPPDKRDRVFDFRGLRVGESATPAALEQAMRDKDLVQLRDKWCGAGSEGMQVCNGLTTVAGTAAMVNAVIDSSGRLIRISLSIPSDDFDRVIQGAKDKYGEPTKITSQDVHNRMGAIYTNTTVIWGNHTRNYIEASRYGSDLDRGYVYFGTAEDTALLNRAEAAARQRGAF